MSSPQGDGDDGDNLLWLDNSIQFPRLLAELYAVVDYKTVREAADSMDLTDAQVDEVFQRACAEWERIKSELPK